MNQFKDVFLGLDKGNYSCNHLPSVRVRAGRKHNDLKTSDTMHVTRHFLRNAGQISASAITSKHDAIQLPVNGNYRPVKTGLLCQRAFMGHRLWVKTDDEAYEIWEKEVGIPRESVSSVSATIKAPYASDVTSAVMGDTGPRVRAPKSSTIMATTSKAYLREAPEEDGDFSAILEIWNIVFMQFNRQADGTMELLPKPSVDTGIWGWSVLPRYCKHVNSNYDIDLFRHVD